MNSEIPSTMRAARFDRYGDPEVLEVRSAPVPTPGEGEVLVRVHASGLNPKDALIRSGGMRLLTGRTFPRGTGFDFAGEVSATGRGVTDLAPGRSVWGFLDGFLGGAAADYVVAPRESLAPKPEKVGWVEAAGLPLVGSTALQGLRDVGRLAPDQRVLIRGASGGVGSAAIQIARALGAHVTAIASGTGREHCLALGAERFVDYRETDPTSLDERFDVFLDCVGGSSLLSYGRLLGRGGRWVTVAPSLPVYALAPLSPVVSPILGLPRLGFVAVKPRSDDLMELGGMVERGILRMPVTETYRLDEIQAAHADVAERHGRGKSVLAVSPEAMREAEPSETVS